MEKRIVYLKPLDRRYKDRWFYLKKIEFPVTEYDKEKFINFLRRKGAEILATKQYGEMLHVYYLGPEITRGELVSEFGKAEGVFGGGYVYSLSKDIKELLKKKGIEVREIA